MSLTKSKKSSLWFQCEKCSVFLLHKDIENHDGFCPPQASLDLFQHTYIHDKVLYGTLDIKPCESIKNLNNREKNGMVFVSQAAMQLCEFSIGDFVSVASAVPYSDTSIVQRVWPTNEKSLTSVLVTKNCLENLPFKDNAILRIEKFDDDTSLIASHITVSLLKGPKSLEITAELNHRLLKNFEGRYLGKGNLISVMFYGSELKFEVLEIEGRIGDINTAMQKMSVGDEVGDKPKFYKAYDHTKWTIFGSQESYIESTSKTKTYNIAGLDTEVAEIQEMLDVVLRKTKSSYLLQSKSVLLYGNSGTGKTTLAKILADKSGATVVDINAPDLYSKNSSSPEDSIKELFKKAAAQSPSVIILDEIDTLCPTRNGRISDSEKRIVSTVLTCIDEVSQDRKSKVFIIATTNKIDSIDAAFRRCGRLDREIEIPTPNPTSRNQIIRKLLLDTPQNLSESDYQELAYTTHGFVGADLLALCSHAILAYSKRMSEAVEMNDFKMALRKVRPSAMREVQIEVPNVKWADIGGQDHLKLILRQAVEWPLKYAESFTRLGITPPKGVLMFGPPGCSKTMIAKALATESGLNFLSIKGPELFSKWVGESEKAVREVFRKARQVAPSIVFFDEIDALGGERSSGSSTSVQERVLAQLLTELDGVTPLGDVTILAATNRPDKIDKALVRPGRLDRIVYVPLPDEKTRMEIFKIKLAKMPVKDVCINNLVSRTPGYSGAEVNAVCHEAAMAALEEDIQSQFVEMHHFEKALKMITPRTPDTLIKVYEDYINVKI